MSKEEMSADKKASRAVLLRQERERHGWSQSDFALRMGTTQVTVSRWENGLSIPGPYFRQRLEEVFGKSLEALGFFVDVEGNAPPEEGVSSLLSPAQFQSVSQPLWNVPFRRNPFFTGREEILSVLYSELTGSDKAVALTQAQAISGLGGIGKTQIAVEYAYCYRASYQVILWVTASSRNTLTADYIMLAALLDLPEQHEPDQHIVVMAVKRWLTLHDRWLLILDNVDDLAMIADFLPVQGMGDVLLTTRLQALGSIARSVEVEKMGLDEGIMFLLRRTRVLAPGSPLDQATQAQREQAAEIVTALDGLPLALDQAGAYIEETRCGFAAYQNLYRTRRKELLLRRGRLPVDHPEPIAATWSLSFQRIEQENCAAADLLRLFSFFSPEAIPEEILVKGAAELGPELGRAASDSLALNTVIELLLNYSLIRRTPETEFLSIHRLVQAVLKDSMDQTQQFLWAERSIRAINRAFPEIEPETWAQCQRCLPHAQMSAVYLKEYQFVFPEGARLLNQAANYLSTHAQYVPAEPLLRQALAIYEQVFVTDHPKVASALSDLGVLCLVQGKYQQAAPLLEEALAIRQRISGFDDPTTASSLNNLALLYAAQGKYQLAEQLAQQALKIRQRVLVPEHPDIAQSLGNLAELCTAQGKYAQAETLYLQAQSSQEKFLGPQHPDAAKTLNNLALLYRSMGEYLRAEQIYQRALDVQKQVLGPKHPDVARTLYNLARLYRAQGEYIGAEPFYQEALAIRREVFGPDHPHVAQCLHGLAKLYNSQGKYVQAEELGLQALKIQEQLLGAEHPELAFTLGTLAKIYYGQEKLDRAGALNMRALQIRERASGPNHPHIALLTNNQAEIYHAQKKYGEARRMIDRSLAIHRQTLGPDHPYMAYSLSNLAENLFFQKDYTSAEHFLMQALTIREQNLGSHHPRTASTYHVLARLYHAQRRYEEAEVWYRRALEAREEVLGGEHPAVALSLEYYALLLYDLDRSEEAQVMEDRSRIIRANGGRSVASRTTGGDTS